MISGLYQSASGMLTQMENHRIISENLSALSVPGFRRSQTSFETYLDPNKPAGSDTSEMTRVLGSKMYPAQAPMLHTTTDFSKGQLDQDHNPQHAAIEGAGFFVVEMPDGQGRGYTRDGTFHVNAQGEIVASNGWRVLGEDGQALVLPKPYQGFLIADTGDVIQQGTAVGKIQVANFKNAASDLHWAGGNFFVPNSPGVEMDPEASPTRLMQGYVERSNVNCVQEMVSMINASRAYEANQKMLQTQDSTLDQVIRQVAGRA